MKRTITPLALLAALALLAMAQGCTAYKVAVDERTMGQIYDDESITFEIERKFLTDDTVKYLDFKSYSYLGRVYLLGEYENTAQIGRAKTIASSVQGVKNVTTYLLPKREDDLCGTTDNLEMKAILDKRLLEDESVHGTNVDTSVLQCNIVLLGLVGSAAEREQAEAIAGTVKGARSVKSFLRVYQP
jgi:hyperosmotically inducible protein